MKTYTVTLTFTTTLEAESPDKAVKAAEKAASENGFEIDVCEVNQVNLEDTEERANVTCDQYIEEYVRQFGGSNREAFESFCTSAVIDATEVEDQKLIAELYQHLDPDVKHAYISVAQAGKIALQLRQQGNKL